jgi:hypothetical protein
VTTQEINERVDDALHRNLRAERIIIGMTVGIFLMGIAILLVGYQQKNPYVASGSIIMQGFLYWPFNELKKVRRDNLVLQTMPAMISALPPKLAVQEMLKLMTYIRSEGHG